MPTLVRDFSLFAEPLIREVVGSCANVANLPLRDYNEFIQTGMEAIFQQEIPINFQNNIFLKFNKVRAEKPMFEGKKLTPDWAMKSKMTYSSLISVMATFVECQDGRERILCQRRIPLFHLPVMVGADNCWERETVRDMKGFFIINGTCRTLISFIRPNYNMALVSPIRKRGNAKIECDFRSLHNDLTNLIRVLRDNEGFFTVSVPFIKTALSAGQVLCAMGNPWTGEDLTPADLPIIQHFLQFNEQAMCRLVQQMTHEEKREQTQDYLWTRDEAIAVMIIQIEKTIKEKRLPENLRRELGTEIFVQTGFGSLTTNARYILYMMRLTEMSADDRRPFDDKDSLINKRVDTCFEHLTQLIRGLFRRNVCKSLARSAQELLDHHNIGPDMFDAFSDIIKETQITTKIQSCFATGNWDVKGGAFKQAKNYVREGVSQLLAQQNMIQFVSHMRRTTHPIATDSINMKINQPRLFHSSQTGFLCPFETPEGGTVGIVCNFAMSAQTTLPFDPFVTADIIRSVDPFVSIDRMPDSFCDTLVLLNGIILGYTNDPDTFVTRLRERRRLGHFPHHGAIVWLMKEKEIRCHVDGGRLVRPLFVVSEGNKLLYRGESLAQALDNRSVALVDVAELDTATVAMTLQDLERANPTLTRFHYMELHPCFLFAENSASTSFSNCNQAPRNLYVTSMRKQAMGVPLSDNDANSYSLNYPQNAITSTFFQRLVFGQHPMGANVVVASITDQGYNQEDAIILKKGSIERGLFNVEYFHVIVDREKGSGGKDPSKKQQNRNRHLNARLEHWEPVPDEIKNSQFIHHDLDERGIILPHNQRITTRRHLPLEPMQVLVSKRGIHRVDVHGKMVDVEIDKSLVLKSSEQGCFVHKVEVSRDADNLTICKITLRYSHKPEVGDKLASAHGQKGVIGAIYADEDMPFTPDGIIPDILINPHAFPSRMTINYLMDGFLGVLASVSGLCDTTPFEHDYVKEVQEIKEQVEERKLQDMYCGKTGRKIKVNLQIVYYYALSQLVGRKVYARGSASSGPVDSVRQPVSGRSREGGLRFGEMERDVLLAHGASRSLFDRLFTCSDAWTETVCRSCRTFSGTKNCHMCGSSEDTLSVDLNFATKLLCERITSMTGKISLTVDPIEIDCL